MKKIKQIIALLFTIIFSLGVLTNNVLAETAATNLKIYSNTDNNIPLSFPENFHVKKTSTGKQTPSIVTPVFSTRLSETPFMPRIIVIYKRSRKQHIKLHIRENLSCKRKSLLSTIQSAMLNKECPISFRIKKDKIFISYDETIIEKNKRLLDLKENRILGIDMNPNFIGLSILKFEKNDTFNILFKEVFDISEL